MIHQDQRRKFVKYTHDYKQRLGITPLIEHCGGEEISELRGIERLDKIVGHGPVVFTPRLAQRRCGPWLCSLLLLLALLFPAGGNSSMCQNGFRPLQRELCQHPPGGPIRRLTEGRSLLIYCSFLNWMTTGFERSSLIRKTKTNLTW